MPVNSVSRKKDRSRRKDFKKDKENKYSNDVTADDKGDENNNCKKHGSSKLEIERQLKKIKEKERILEEQLKLQEEEEKMKKKGKTKGGSGGIGKKKVKELTKLEVKSEIEEIKKTPMKHNAAVNKNEPCDTNNNNNTVNPMKASILETLKKDIVKTSEKSPGCDEDEPWSMRKEYLLQKHLQTFHSLMEVQPKRHTEAQIKMERQKMHEATVEQQKKELQKIRLANIYASDTDPGTKKKEFLRKQQEKERKRNQEEMSELQHVGMNKKAKPATKDKKISAKIPVVVKTSSQQISTKKAWGCFKLDASNDVIWPEVKPKSHGNIWSERERKQQMLETLIPKTSQEEEDMMRQALEISKKTAEEESDFRNVNSRYYPPDDDDLAKLLVNRISMESQQLAEWIESPNKPAYKKIHSDDVKSVRKTLLSPPNEPLSKWNHWSKLESQTEITSHNPKEKLPHKQQKVISSQKIKSSEKPVNNLIEEAETWSEEEIVNDSHQQCFDAHRELCDTENRSDNCGIDAKSDHAEIFKFSDVAREYYDPHGGARPKYQHSNSIWSPPKELEPAEMIKPEWKCDTSQPQSQTNPFSQRCTVDPEFETLSCSAVKNRNQNNASEILPEPQTKIPSQRCTVDPEFETLSCSEIENQTNTMEASPFRHVKLPVIKVKVESHPLEFACDSFSDDEDWNCDIDYVGPECDPELKKSHLTYSGYSVKGLQISHASANPNKACTETSCSRVIESVPNNKPAIPVTSASQTSQPKGIRFKSARSKFAKAKAQFLLKQSNSNASLLDVEATQSKSPYPAVTKSLHSASESTASKLDSDINEPGISQSRIHAIQNNRDAGTSVVDVQSLDTEYASPLYCDIYEPVQQHRDTTVLSSCKFENAPSHGVDWDLEASANAYPPILSNSTTVVNNLSDNLLTGELKACDPSSTIPSVDSIVDSVLSQIHANQGTNIHHQTPNILLSAAPILNNASNPKMSDLPLGLPPHLVNAYLLFLQQQDGAPSLKNTYKSSSNNPLKSSIPNLPSSASNSTMSNPNSLLPNIESLGNSLQQSKLCDDLISSNVNSVDANTSILTSSSALPTSRLYQTNQLKQAANQNLLDKRNPVPSSHSPDVLNLNNSSIQDNNFPTNNLLPCVQSNIVQCSKDETNDSLSNPSASNTFINSSVPVMNAMDCLPARNMYPNVIPQNLPMLYPSFNPFLSAVPSAVTKTHNPPVFTHSVHQQQKQQQTLPMQQHVQTHQQQLPQEKIDPGRSNNAATEIISKVNSIPVIKAVSSNMDLKILSNKERLTRKLECLNKVKSLMEEVRKDGGMMK